ncbi:ABC transporter ATP-binding protein [Pedobacter sp. ASV28]|uniref:ABC transporter ATP-binding protein n=1 Tax=Pedobacter sp. ASV28 TaxID=2795123 RepID=UPI0018EB85F2|nr:ABC transporter ATP-binding protein [Pedobacter sp. ASV28]
MKTQDINANKASLSGLPGRHGRIKTGKPQHSLQTILRLWKYLGRQKLKLLVILLLLLLNIGATLSGSYLLRPIINHYIIPKDVPGLIKMVALLLGIYLISAVAATLQNRLMINVAQQTVSKIRSELFCRLQSIPLKFFDTHSQGDLMSRFANDTDNISDLLNTSVLQLFSSGITLVGIFALMLYISPELTLITLLIVPLMLWFAAGIIKKSKVFFATQQSALGAVNGYVEEMVNGQKVVEVFGYQQSVEAAFEKLNYDLRDKATQAQLYAGVMMPVIQNLNTINFALTAIVGGLLAILKGFDLGGLAAFLQYSRQFGRPVNEISSQYNSIQSGLAGAERVFQIMDEIPELPDSPDAVVLANVRGNVNFRSVTFGYDPAHPVITNLTLEVKAGQKIAFVGATGAGKTTIMNLLPRFYDIQSGEITIDGIPIQHIKRNNLRQALAIVLQDTHLFTGTVLENIRYGQLQATDNEVIEACKLAGADPFIQQLAKGYATVLQKDGDNLSQGQRQLLNIARATVSQPAILIMDEATSSVDTRTEQYIQRGMDQLMIGRTSFVIAHRLSTVRNADEIIVLENGKIIERGNHDALLAKRGKYYQLYTTQFD